MATVTNIQDIGNQLTVVFDDGSQLPAYPTNTGVWFVGTGVEFVPPPDNPTAPPVTPPPPTPGKFAVVFPCDVHNVSDSFQDHKNRGSANPGTDYTASYGSEVRAVASGTVTDISDTISGGGGRMIHVDHNDGSGADYLHLSRRDVALGATVTQGQHIALSGASGLGSEHGYGAHLHISYRLNHNHGWSNSGNIDFDAYIRSLGLT